jgi:acyl-CoA synthetase (AMP-forming)/AMP-acid ligase II
LAVIDFFDRGWRQNRTGIAYRDGKRAWTFDETYALTCQIARALLDGGFAREAKAAVLSPNDPVAWICVLGIWRAGLAWVPLNPAHTADASRELLDSFDCEVLFFHSSLASVVSRLRPSLPGVRRYVCIDAESVGAVSLGSWVAGQPATNPKVEYDMDDVVAVTPTGGTTGLPKGVMSTHRNHLSSFAHMMLAFHYPAGEPIVNLAAAPMTHAAAGDTNLKVTSTGTPCNPGGACTGTTSFIIGQPLLIGSGTAQETVTVTSVGTAGAAGTGVTFTRPRRPLSRPQRRCKTRAPGSRSRRR